MCTVNINKSISSLSMFKALSATIQTLESAVQKRNYYRYVDNAQKFVPVLKHVSVFRVAGAAVLAQERGTLWSTIPVSRCQKTVTFPVLKLGGRAWLVP
jgi:hypothetical protein